MTKNITIKVPATTANMGPGFDCLGMALDIWNSIEIKVGTPNFAIHGQGHKQLPSGKNNLIYKSLTFPFNHCGQEVPEMSINCYNEIPLSKGLGSSSAAIVAGLLAGNELCQNPLEKKQLLEIATELDGHPDNVSAALLGGCQIVIQNQNQLVTSGLQVPTNLGAVIFIPNSSNPTRKARAILPRNISREDAVYNIGRMGLLTKALATNDFKQLWLGTQDTLHQPAREKMFPHMKNIFKAAMDAGALGVFLSGAGSSILALTKDRETTVGYEMSDAAARFGVDGTIKITHPTNLGAHIEGNT